MTTTNNKYFYYESIYIKFGAFFHSTLPWEDGPFF